FLPRRPVSIERPITRPRETAASKADRAPSPLALAERSANTAPPPRIPSRPENRASAPHKACEDAASWRSTPGNPPGPRPLHLPGSRPAFLAETPNVYPVGGQAGSKTRG